MDPNPSASQTKTLLALARADRAVTFWRTLCDHLRGLAASDLIVVQAHAGELAFEKRASRRALVEVIDPAVARRLSLPGMLHQLGDYAFKNGVARLTEAQLAATSARECPVAQRHGCVDALTMTFSVDRYVALVNITLFRARDASVAAPRAIQALRRLYPLLQPLIVEHNTRSVQRTLVSAAQDLIADFPVGLAVFDWLGRVLYANDEAYRVAHEWVSDRPGRKRKLTDLRRHFPQVPGLEGAIHALLSDWYHTRPPRRSQVTLHHPTRQGWRVIVSNHVPAEGSADPIAYVVRFASPATDKAADLFDTGRAEIGLLAQLSPSERQVAMMAMRGMTNVQIASAIHREVSTVKDHLSHVFAKLGVTNRTQLAGLALSGRAGGRPEEPTSA